jgi:hypothetical protein
MEETMTKMDDWAKEIDTCARLEATAVHAEEIVLFANLPKAHVRTLLAIIERTFVRGAACGEVAARGVCGLM